MKNYIGFSFTALHKIIAKWTLISIVFSICLQTSAAYEIHPKAKIYRRPASKSRILWNRDQKVTDGAESYFRYEFNIPEPVRDGVFRVYFDDSGIVYLNGKKIDPRKVPANLQTGKNLLAFKTVNRYSYAGLIFYGAVRLKSGKEIYLHSIPSIKAAANPSEGWERPGFDDSAWKPSLDQGDVLAMPWSRHYDLVKLFASPLESSMIAEDERRSTTLAPDIAATPPPRAKIMYSGNQPKISIGGKLYDPIIAICEGEDEFNRSFLLKAGEMGIKLYHLYFSDEHSYRGKGKSIDFSRLDTQIRHMLHLIPDSQLELNVIFGRSDIWCRENPGEVIQYADGPVEDHGKLREERIGRPRRPSPASEKYRRHVHDYLHALCEFIKSQPWGNRIYAVRLSFGVYTEWHYYGYLHGPDSSNPMIARFRSWLKNKYKTQAALQQAWKDLQVTFLNASAPSWKERNPEGALLDPVRSQKTIDFFNCLAEVNADLLLMMARQIKKELPGRLCGAYYGYVFSTQPPEGANVLLDKVIGAPEIDFTSDPATYDPSIRQAGGSFTQRAISATSRRYGKLSIVEDDTRFHQLPGIITEHYATRTPLESQMVVRRNFCNMLFNGIGLQINDASRNIGRRPHTFDDPAVFNGIKESLAVLKKAGIPESCSGNSCALVVDYRERFRRSGRTKPGSIQIYRTYEVLRSLYRAGIAFDTMSLQDFLASRQNYPNVIFLNLYSPSPSERREILAKIRKPGVTAIWLTAPGSVTDSGFSDRVMSELTGIRLAGAGVLPKVHCLEPDLKKLPANALLKVLPDQSKAVFSPEVPYTGKQWHDLLKAIGIHAYASPGSYLRRHGRMLLFHTEHKGLHTLTLPEKSGTFVELFSGKTYNAPVIKIVSDGPGTWLFKLQ